MLLTFTFLNNIPRFLSYVLEALNIIVSLKRKWARENFVSNVIRRSVENFFRQNLLLVLLYIELAE